MPWSRKKVVRDLESTLMVSVIARGAPLFRISHSAVNSLPSSHPIVMIPNRQLASVRRFWAPSLLVSQIAPTAANFEGRPRLLLPSRTCFVASARTGYAIRLIQAIDGERTFTFPDLRPCRLLQGPTLISRVVVQPNSFFQLSSCSWRTQVGLPVSFCTPRRVPARHRSTRRTC